MVLLLPMQEARVQYLVTLVITTFGQLILQMRLLGFREVKALD